MQQAQQNYWGGCCHDAQLALKPLEGKKGPFPEWGSHAPDFQGALLREPSLPYTLDLSKSLDKNRPQEWDALAGEQRTETQVLQMTEEQAPVVT